MYDQRVLDHSLCWFEDLRIWETDFSQGQLLYLNAIVLRKIFAWTAISPKIAALLCKQQTITHLPNHQDAHISKHHYLPHLAIWYPDDSRICTADYTYRSLLQCADAHQSRSLTSFCVRPNIPVLPILAFLQHLAPSSAQVALLLQALPQRQPSCQLGLWRRRWLPREDYVRPLQARSYL